MISERVKALREGRGWTQNYLAERAGISATFLRNIERGITKRPSLPTIEALAGALGVPLSEITGEQEMGTSEAALIARVAERHGMSGEELARILALFGALPDEVEDIILEIGESLLKRTTRRDATTSDDEPEQEAHNPTMGRAGNGHHQRAGC